MSAAWAPLAPALAANSHLIMVDRPGCGLTDKLNYRGVSFRQHSVKFTREFLDSIGVRKTSIIANSMGGYFALAFALAYPERVDKLILIGAPPLIIDSLPSTHVLLGIPGLNRFIYALKATKESFGGPSKPPSWLYARPEQRRLESVAAQQSADALPGAEESWLTMVEEVIRNWHTYNIKNELGRIQAPTLFVIGDKELNADTTGELATTMPNAIKVIISNAAHITWSDDPRACERAILPFLAERPAAAETRIRSLN
jgi:pimeloyl-ACP methyl ester carboxylesterase